MRSTTSSDSLLNEFVKLENLNSAGSSANDIESQQSTKALSTKKRFIKNVVKIEKVLGVTASQFNGYAPALSAITIAKGWPKLQPKLILPSLYVGSISVWMSLAAGLCEMSISDDAKVPVQDYKALIEAINTWLFTTRFTFGVYDFIASDFGRNENEIDGTLTDFFAIIGSSAAPALIYMIYNIKNNHQEIKNKPMKLIGLALNALAAAALIRDSIEIIYPVENYTVQFGIYAGSFLAGLGMAGAHAVAPEKAKKIIEYVNAINIAYMIAEIFMQLMEVNESDAEKLALYIAFLITLCMPTLTGLALSIYTQFFQQEEINLSDLAYEPSELQELLSSDDKRIEEVIEDEETLEADHAELKQEEDQKQEISETPLIASSFFKAGRKFENFKNYPGDLATEMKVEVTPLVKERKNSI